MNSNREKVVIRTSIVSILSNIILASFKALVGVASHSIAVISDAVNNLSDALSSIITIIGTKLSGKPADQKHPYGYGRIEYITSLTVSAIVVYAGITTLIESIKKIIRPEAADYTNATLIIIIAGIVVKFTLGLYVKQKGKKVNSDSLVASGSDAFNDALLSISVLVCAIIDLVWHISLEAYVGVLLSLFIVKSGIELIKESVDDMLGTRVETALAQNIKNEISKQKDVLGAFDLVLNNYGPDKYLGSVHIEVLDTLSVAQVDKISRNITKIIMDKYGVVLHTIGIYSVNTKDDIIKTIQDDIQTVVFSHDGVLQMHGFYLDESEKEISFDVIIDFKVKNRENLVENILSKLNEKYKNYTFNIALDIDISD